MKSTNKISFFAKYSATIFSVCCALIFITPSIFAKENISATPTKDTSTYKQILNLVYDFAIKNYVDEVDPQKLYEGALKGMMESLDDPYTTYLDTAGMRSLTDTTVGNFGGVGLSITKTIASTVDKPAYVEVVSPIEGGPGYRAGIQAGDLIIEVEGKPTPEMTMEEVLDKLRGKVGEKVQIKIRRGKNIEQSFVLTRQIIEVPTVKSGTIMHRGSNIGYIKIIEFTPMTAEKVKDALYELDGSNDGLIIDLRNNPGGLISSVQQVADLFIDDGVIVSTRGRDGVLNDVLTANPGKTVYKSKKPLIVLINKGSASAAEILSGALKDYKLAYLLGEQSYGKGSVQQLIPLYNNDGVKITMARYYTPSDVNIDKIGIPPDREVKNHELTEEEEKAYVKMYEDDAIAKYVDLHPAMSENDIALAARELNTKYKIDLRVLRRLVRVQVNRTKDPELYDLDYDEQLVAALNLIENEDFAQLMKSTKTLKQLQDASLLKKKSEGK